MSAEIYEQLEAILINTYNPSKELRTLAEEQLKQFLKLPNAFIGFLGLVGEPTRSPDVKLAAALTLKNNARFFFDLSMADQRPYQISDDEKEQSKVAILGMILNQTEKKLRTLLCEIMKAIAEHEHSSGRWPALIPTLLINIQQQADPLKIYNSLAALRKLVKFYEFKRDDSRAPLHAIMKETFPPIQALLSTLATQNSLEVGMVFHQALKIFWSCVMYHLPPVGIEGVDVNFWFQFMASIIEKPLPEASENLEPTGQPVHPEERKQWPWWKAKKWATKIVSHICARYGNPKHAPADTLEFSKHFRSTISVSMLGPIMNVLASKVRGEFVTDDVLRQCLAYMNTAVEMAPAYKNIKPHLEFLLFQVVVPTLAVRDSDLQMFHDDPSEFVRMVHNPLVEWVDPRMAATNLLETLGRYRGKDVLPMILAFCSSSLDTYNAEQDVNRKDHKLKDAVLVVMASLASILLKSKQYGAMMEPFLMAHVVPEFNSPVAFIRSRVCWLIEFLNDLKWNQCNPQLIDFVLKGLLQGLRDPHLAVQAAAACSMSSILGAPGAQDVIKPILPDIVREYFRIMDELESDSVLNALQAIVENFSEDIVGLAPSMVVQLVKHFNVYTEAGFDDDEAAFSATQCLDTISAIVNALEEHPASLAELENLLLPLIGGTIAVDCFEFLENGLDFISQFTYYSDRVSPAMWSLCGPLLVAMNGWAFDFLPEMMTPMLNYMTKNEQTFHTSTVTLGNGEFHLAEILLQACQKSLMIDDSMMEREAKVGATLLTCFISTSKADPSVVRPYTARILHMIMARICEFPFTPYVIAGTTEAVEAGKGEPVKTRALKNRLLEVGLALIYADAPFVINMMTTDAGMGQLGALFFDKLFENLSNMENPGTQRILVMAFSNLLALPHASLPPVCQHNIQSIFMQAVREVDLLKDAGEDICLKTEEDGDEDPFGGDEDDMGDFGSDDGLGDDEDGEESDDEDDGNGVHSRKGAAARANIPEGGYGEEEDVENAEDTEYLEYLEQVNANGSTRYLHGEPVDDEEERDELDFTSPCDGIDVLNYLVDALNAARTMDAAHLQNLHNQLNPADQARLVGLMNESATRRQG